jgi:hypothetical protein
MESCGISGDVRVVNGVPFRLTQNRTDTSWAEEYLVEAGEPLPYLGTKPRRFAGPWRRVATLVGEGDGVGGLWRMSPLPALHFEGDHERLHTFNDALAELASLWKRRGRHPGGEAEAISEMAFWGRPAR